jgi:hypothetical protein
VYKYENGWNYKRLKDLFHEMAVYLGDLHTMYIESIIGYAWIYKFVQKKQDDIRGLLGPSEVTEEEFQDECSITYESIYGVDITPMLLTGSAMKQGNLKDRNRPGGRNELEIGKQCVVSLYSFWEDYLRLELAKAKGLVQHDKTKSKKVESVLSKHMSFDFWGDISLLRNSIVHHNSISTDACGSKAKIFKWFPAGSEIALTYQHMRIVFMEAARFRNLIHEWSFPEHYIQISGVRRR